MISRIIDEKSITEARKLIEAADKIVVLTHQTPDGDAVGSSLAAVHVFSSLGKDIRAVVPDAPLVQLRTLPGAKELVDAARYPDFAAKLIGDADLLLCLDFNGASRTGRLEEVLNKATCPKILIDHHEEPGLDEALMISYPAMAATCYLLFRFFCRLELFNDIDAKAAQCLLAGMMTDTGNFAYNCSDPELYIVVAELIRKGADKEKLYRDLFNTQSENCMRLNSYAIYKKMEVFKDYGAALITLTRDELNRFHYVKGDTEGLVNRPLAIPGVHYCAFMRQESDRIRVSMRSVGTFPVNLVCKEHFTGGGHLNAAGGDFFGTMEEARQAFIDILPQYKDKLG